MTWEYADSFPWHQHAWKLRLQNTDLYPQSWETIGSLWSMKNNHWLAISRDEIASYLVQARRRALNLNYSYLRSVFDRFSYVQNLLFLSLQPVCIYHDVSLGIHCETMFLFVCITDKCITYLKHIKNTFITRHESCSLFSYYYHDTKRRSSKQTSCKSDQCFQNIPHVSSYVI